MQSMRLPSALISAAGVATLGMAAFGLAPAALARGGEAFLSLDWSDTGNNNGAIEPGESAIVTLSSLQVWDGQGDEYIAFGFAVIDVITADAGADVNGHTIMNGLADINPPGDTAEENGGNIENATFVQFSFIGYVTDNPITLMRFQVDFSDYAARNVTYSTSLEDSLGVVGVIARTRDGHFVRDSYAGFNDSVDITVVPAPAVLSLLGLGACAASRRSR